MATLRSNATALRAATGRLATWKCRESGSQMAGLNGNSAAQDLPANVNA